MKLGLFGGSFDPVHRGHVEPVLQAVEQLGLEQVIYLPTATPPHKMGREMAPAHVRATMVELALLDHSRLLVDGFELGSGTHYTVDSLRHFRGRFPQARLHYLLGSDAFLSLPGWREAPAILELAELVVLARGPVPEASSLPAALRAARVHWVENPQVDISSSAVRVAWGRDRAALTRALHPRVIRFLDKYPHLYAPHDA